MWNSMEQLSPVPQLENPNNAIRRSCMQLRPKTVIFFKGCGTVKTNTYRWVTHKWEDN